MASSCVGRLSSELISEPLSAWFIIKPSCPHRHPQTALAYICTWGKLLVYPIYPPRTGIPAQDQTKIRVYQLDPQVRSRTIARAACKYIGSGLFFNTSARSSYRRHLSNVQNHYTALLAFFETADMDFKRESSHGTSNIYPLFPPERRLWSYARAWERSRALWEVKFSSGWGALASDWLDYCGG